jgi:hypothetical protein
MVGGSPRRAKRIVRTFVGPRKETMMRGNSGGGTSQNNNRNPTLKEHERAKGVSGNAIQGEKKASTGADRKSARKTGADASP